jgi:replicative DNA helicase
MYLQESTDYENSLLSTIFLFPETHSKVFNRIHPDHFAPGGINRKVYAVLQRLHEEHKPNHISTRAIIAELCSLLEAEDRNWSFWVDHLTSEYPVATDLEFYINRIIKNFNKRRLYEIQNAAQKRIENGDSGEAVAAYTRQQLDTLETGKKGGEPICFFDVAADCIEQLQTSDNDALTGIPTGFNLLDKYILGMRPGDLMVIAGRPSMGKTTLAVNIAINAAKSGYTGLIFSLEMSKYRLGLRMISNETECNLYALSKGIVHDFNQITDISGNLKNLYIDFTTALGWQDVEARIKEFSESKKVDFIMLDYLQKLRFKSRDRHDLAVAQATGAFKNIAKDMNIPFVLLSQLSRANEKQGQAVRKPRLSDLRDSGAIEQDADIVCFLHREEVYKPDDEKYRNKAELILAKNRDGDTCFIDLVFRKNINRFEDATRD